MDAAQERTKRRFSDQPPESYTFDEYFDPDEWLKKKPREQQEKQVQSAAETLKELQDHLQGN